VRGYLDDHWKVLLPGQRVTHAAVGTAKPSTHQPPSYCCHLKLQPSTSCRTPSLRLPHTPWHTTLASPLTTRHPPPPAPAPGATRCSPHPAGSRWRPRCQAACCSWRPLPWPQGPPAAQGRSQQAALAVPQTATRPRPCQAAGAACAAWRRSMTCLQAAVAAAGGSGAGGEVQSSGAVVPATASQVHTTA
jgi:hypothetical protein